MNDETPLRLTDHELLALLAVNQTPSADTTRAVFRLSPVADNELLEQAGITTLLVRGLAEVSGDDIVPVVGARTVARLAETLGALDVHLGAGDLAAIAAAVPDTAVAGERYAPAQMAQLDSERAGVGS